MASIGFKRFILSSKDMMSGDYESAILHLNKVPRKLFELSSHVAFNKSFCFEKLGDMSRALDESLKSLYIYPNDSRYYVKTGMLCQQLCRFFEAEFCLQNGLRCLTLGDIISAIKLTSLLKQNIYFAIKRSDCGLDETIIMAPCLCCRNLKEASQKLRNVEVFRAKYIWSTSTVSSPADDFVEIDSDYSSKDSETQYEGHLHTILNKF